MIVKYIGSVILIRMYNYRNKLLNVGTEMRMCVANLPWSVWFNKLSNVCNAHGTFVIVMLLVRTVSKIIVTWLTKAPMFSCGFLESYSLIAEGE